MDLVVLGQNAVKAKYLLQALSTEEKNQALKVVAKALVSNAS